MKYTSAKLSPNLVVLLDWNEAYHASHIGIRRIISSLAKGFSDRNGAEYKSEAEQWFYGIRGAQGECAFAKYAGLEWLESVDAPKDEPDVLPDWQVRTRKHKGKNETHELMIRPDDLPCFKYVLMTGSVNTFHFKGWIWGDERARKPQYWGDRDGRGKYCWWIPEYDLDKNLP